MLDLSRSRRNDSGRDHSIGRRGPLLLGLRLSAPGSRAEVRRPYEPYRGATRARGPRRFARPQCVARLRAGNLTPMSSSALEVILARQVAGSLAVPILLVNPGGDLLFFNEAAE